MVKQTRNPRRKSSKSIISRVKKLERHANATETKRHTTEFNEVSVPQTLQTTTIPVINDMTVGDTAANIDGAQYALTGIAYRFLVHNQTSVDLIYRMAIVRVKVGSALSTTGESLFLQGSGNGLDFDSASAAQRYILPLNRRKYDVIFERMLKVGKTNSTYTNQVNNNFIIKGYKRFANKKETMNSSGNPDTKYQLVAWVVDANLDGNLCSIEQTGQTVFYFKDN